jgi:Domain of unknown function (DUF4333)
MRLLAAFLLSTAVLAGCGSDDTKTVDTAGIEQQIGSQLSGPTVRISSVSCPGDVEKQKGDTFDCSVKIEGGGSATVVVTQVNGVNQYTSAFKPGTLKIPGSAVEPVVQKDLEADGVDVTGVSCPQTIIVKENSPVTCSASTASGAGVEVTFSFTASGEVDPSSVETS